MWLEGYSNLAHHDYSKHSLLPSTCRDPKVHRFGESRGKSNALYSNKKPYTISLMCLIIKYMKITTIVMLNYCFLDTKSLKGWCKPMRLCKFTNTDNKIKYEIGQTLLILIVYAAAAKSLQSCPALCDTMDCSLPGSSVHGIFQARVLEWVPIALSASICKQL